MNLYFDTVSEQIAETHGPQKSGGTLIPEASRKSIIGPFSKEFCNMLGGCFLDLAKTKGYML